MKRKNLVLMALFAFAPLVTAQTYVFDGDLSTPGIQNGSGAWSVDGATAANLRWLKDGSYSAWDNSGLAIAEFGSSTSVTGGTVTLDGEMFVAGMNFNPLGTPLGGNSYLFTGGTINFGSGAVINIANGASGGGAGLQWVTFNSLLKGENLTIQKSTGSSTGFVRIGAVNTNLTGTLTLKSAAGATSGIYLSVGSPTFIGGLTAIDVKAGSIFNPTGASTYTTALYIAGIGSSNYGAVRVDASNTTLSGRITLTADARLHTHINTLNTIFSGGISETGGSWSLTRTAYAPTTTLSPLTATYRGVSDYTGSTIFGRATGIANTSESAGTEGGVNILDFTDASAPTENMLYNGKTPGALVLIGGLSTQTMLRLDGAKEEDNVQRFGSLNVQQSAAAIVLTSGSCGSMSLELGNITRTGDAVLAMKGPESGRITANVGGVTEGLIGTWATYTSADGKSAGWAGLTGGVVGIFTGDLNYASGANVSAISGYASTSHLRVSGVSMGDVQFEGTGGVSDLATVSMTDTTADRRLDFNGEMLRLAPVGGIQIVAGARSLEVGTLGGGSVLTAGNFLSGSGQILLTNLSEQGVLTINSTITDSGMSPVSLNVNGTGRTVLTGANTFTGIVAIQSGILEIRNNDALGTTGATGLTKIMTGASLHLSGNITVAETIQANGHGIALDGAIRNLSGTNTITTAVRIQSTTRFTSDSGLLVLAGGITAQISATSYTFSGSGDIEVRGAISAATGVLNKEGSGTLTLTGTSTATGITTVSNGTLHLNFDAAGAPSANILYTGAATPGAVTLSGGALRATGKSNTATTQALGAMTFGTGYSRLSASSTGSGSMDISFGAITRSTGGTVRFDLPSSGAIKTTGGADNAVLTAAGVAYATVGLNDWAATSALASGTRNIVGLSSLGGYTNSTATTLAGNADVAGGVTNTTLAASTSVSTLRFNQAQATTIAVGAANTLSTGGILVSSNVGANTTTIEGGSLRAAASSAELVIFQNNTAAPLIITSRILNAASGTGLTKAGAGTLVLKYNAVYATGDYTGTTRIQEGNLQLVKTTATAISYYLYAGANFVLGSGGSSGKLILGGTEDGGHAVTQYGGLLTQGTGTSNAVVGGNAAMATFLHYVTGVHDFRSGFLGGSGTNENNLNLTISLGTLQLGTANTFKGKTNMMQNTIEVTKLADRGQASSLGTGDANSTAHIIDMATATTSSQNYNVLATLRYIGDADSVTNRAINVTNSDIATDVISVVAALENTGKGTVKFTSAFTAGGSNTVQRVLRLGGTNMGENEIVSFADVNATISSKLEKAGTGRWILAGNSTYTGGTTITEGTLQLGNGGTAGMVGAGDIAVADCAALATRRSDTFTLYNNITGEGSLVVNNTSTGVLVIDNVGNTYSGGTRVNTGTLMVNNAYGSGTGTGSVHVEAAGTLAGRGFITASAGNSVVLRGKLSVGEISLSASQIHIKTSGSGTLTVESGGVVELDLITGAGSGMLNAPEDADMLVIGGNVVLHEGSILRVQNLNGLIDWAIGDAWQIIDWDSLGGATRTGAFTALDLPTLTAGFTWDTSELYSSGVIAVAIVPEPGRAMLLLGAFMVVALRRRRK